MWFKKKEKRHPHACFFCTWYCKSFGGDARCIVKEEHPLFHKEEINHHTGLYEMVWKNEELYIKMFQTGNKPLYGNETHCYPNRELSCELFELRDKRKVHSNKTQKELEDLLNDLAIKYLL
jgi:hypothetical protein